MGCSASVHVQDAQSRGAAATARSDSAKAKATRSVTDTNSPVAAPLAAKPSSSQAAAAPRPERPTPTPVVVSGSPAPVVPSPPPTPSVARVLTAVTEAYNRTGKPRSELREALAARPLPEHPSEAAAWVAKAISTPPRSAPASPKPHAKGVDIPEAALRGISPAQLHAIFEDASALCVSEGWKKKHGPGAGEQLKPSEMTLYELVDYYVKPKTEDSHRSLVETIAVGPQPPEWFVSHWWGEPVADFIKCIKKHLDLRKLDANKTYYWVCAYALRQHQLDAELGGAGLDALSSPFQRALGVADGTVTVADSAGISFTRCWCAFESFATLITQGSGFLHDLVTTGGNRGRDNTQLVTDGATASDGPGRSLALAWKAVREKDFPAELLLGVITTFELTKSGASRQEDLDSIIAAVGADRDTFDATMRARFGGAALKLLHLEDHSDAFDRWIRDLTASRLRKFSGDFPRFDEGMRGPRVAFASDAVLRALPHTRIEELRLGYGCIAAEHAPVLAGLVASGQLRELDLARSTVPAEVGVALGDALTDPKCRLETLNLTGNAVGDVGGRALHEGILKNKSLKMLNLTNNKIGGELKQIIIAEHGARVSFS